MSEAPSLRETLESAMQAEGVAPEQAPAEVVTEAAPVAEEAAPVEAPSAAQQRERDAAGRFAKQTAVAAPKGAEKAATGEAAAAAPGKADGAATSPAPSAEPSPPVKAPQSWTASEREAFGKAPAEVQQAVLRREREAALGMQGYAEARKTAETVQRALSPYEGIARANGMDAMSYAGNVLQTAAALQMGTPTQRAQVIAQLIGSYGVDLDAINSALQGAPAARQAPQVDIQAEIARRFEEQAAKQAEQAKLAEARQFLETQPEFWSDVQEDVLGLLRIDRARGGNMTPQQAYDRAVKLNEGVQSVLSSRKSAEAAKANAPSVQRSKAAAVSVKPSPGAAATPQTGPHSLRETIVAAVAGSRT